MSHETPVKYLCCDKAGEQQSKLQRECEKEKVNLEYTTPHTLHLNGVIERRFAVIKEGTLTMMLNAELNDTALKILWADSIHMYKRVINSMATTGSTTSPFKNFYGENTEIIGTFSYFRRIGYGTKRENPKKKTTEMFLTQSW